MVFTSYIFIFYFLPLVLGSWVWFRAASLPEALAYFSSLLGGGISDEASAVLHVQLFAPGKIATLLAGVFLSFSGQQPHDRSKSVNWPKLLVLAPAFAIAVLAMFSQSANPFLYFQF